MHPRMYALFAGNCKRSTILNIKNNQGKGWSEKYYDDDIKQGISMPDNINMANH